METKWPFSPQLAEDEGVLLTDEPLDLKKAIDRVQSPTYGAVVTFSGCVRNSENGSFVQSITYKAYEKMALKVLREIVQKSKRKWHVNLILQHRTGKVPVGETSLIVVCAGVHRREAFEACQYVIDEIKSCAPIWKVEFE